MQDVILKLPSWLLDEADSRLDKVTVVFFITGNPGLVAYYTEFLDQLANNAASKPIVAGASLGGFEIVDSTHNPIEDDVQHFPSYERKAVYDLQDQIRLSHNRLNDLINKIRKDYPAATDLPFEVILIGHSVGAYIALEIIRRHSEDRHVPERKDHPTYNIVSTMLLTPTIHNIAHSSSGKVASPVLNNLPFFPTLVQAGASTLAATLPVTWLKGIVKQVTGMRVEGGLDATVAFLRTPGAVKQALHMARCEMLEIGEDKWTQDVWGAAVSDQHAAGSEAASERGQNKIVRHDPPKHYFLFAKEDHWVANETRDAVVTSLSGRATIVVDDGSMGLSHAWCLEQSGLVAKIVNKWIEEMLLEQQPWTPDITIDGIDRVQLSRLTLS